MKYACESKFYNSGKVITRIIRVKNNVRDSSKRTKLYDVFIDVFDTKAEAIEFSNQQI